MFLACDEAGFTGADLLARDQRYFAFASVNVEDEEAWDIISKARGKFPVQMPELKASKLMASNRGQRLIAEIVANINGRFAVNAHDKLLALCGWVFEYVYEPVFQRDPKIFYEKDFHRFVAMFCYLWFLDSKSTVAADSIRQFQAYMRTKDISKAPILFDHKKEFDEENSHPFECIQRFATGFKKVIEIDNSEIEKYSADRGKWTLELSISSVWSHLNHWGTEGRALTVICDDSKPLRDYLPLLRGNEGDSGISRAKEMFGATDLGWKQEKPIELVDSRAHPSVQLADILASTTVFCHSHGMPSGFDDTAKILDEGMLRDSIFPDFDRVRLERSEAKIHFAVLHQLANLAEGNGIAMPIEEYFNLAETFLHEEENK